MPLCSPSTPYEPETSEAEAEEGECARLGHRANSHTDEPILGIIRLGPNVDDAAEQGERREIERERIGSGADLLNDVVHFRIEHVQPTQVIKNDIKKETKKHADYKCDDLVFCNT